MNQVMTCEELYSTSKIKQKKEANLYIGNLFFVCKL